MVLTNFGLGLSHAYRVHMVHHNGPTGSGCLRGYFGAFEIIGTPRSHLPPIWLHTGLRTTREGVPSSHTPPHQRSILTYQLLRLWDMIPRAWVPNFQNSKIWDCVLNRP